MKSLQDPQWISEKIWRGPWVFTCFYHQISGFPMVSGGFRCFPLLSGFNFPYIYVYIYIYMHKYIYTYIYIYTYDIHLYTYMTIYTSNFLNSKTLATGHLVPQQTTVPSARSRVKAWHRRPPMSLAILQKGWTMYLFISTYIYIYIHIHIHNIYIIWICIYIYINIYI